MLLALIYRLAFLVAWKLQEEGLDLKFLLRPGCEVSRRLRCGLSQRGLCKSFSLPYRAPRANAFAERWGGNRPPLSVGPPANPWPPPGA
jgi:hypothetical protein